MEAKVNEGIVATKLSKRYCKSDKFALKDLSLNVKPGEVYGFLGPNGAGKSTTIKLLMNFIQPTSGSALIQGKDIVNDTVEIKKSVGYLSGDFAVYPKMTGWQYLNYLGDLELEQKNGKTRELAKRLKADLNKRLGNLSRGNKQKIAIIQAFRSEPSVLILDEPTSGLDPLMQEVFYELAREAKSRGACVFMSSHILSEVQKICDRVGIIREGKLVSESNISELAASAAQTFDITFISKPPLTELRKIKNSKIESHDGSNVTIHMHGKLTPLFEVLAKNEVSKIDARNLDLEQLFMHFYQDEVKKK